MIFTACHKYDGQTPHGYDYWQHIDYEGPSPNFGDEVFVYLQIRTQDTVLFESPNKKLGMRAVLQDPSLNPIKDPDPVADVLPLMSEGDSVTVVMAVTEKMRVAPALEMADKLYYEVVLRKVIRADDKENLTSSDPTEKRPSDVVHNKPDLRTPLIALPKGEEALMMLRDFIATPYAATSTSDGLLYRIIENGKEEKLNKGEEAQVRYIGCLLDGTVFGENYTSGWFSFSYGEGRVIKGWEEGLKYLRPEGKMFIAIPPALGYGELGKKPFIGPTDTLYYYLELRKAPLLSQ